MSHDQASDDLESQSIAVPPRLDRPNWNLLATAIAIGASLGIASNLAQLEQRLVPGLLDSPAWLAPVVYVGVTCLPLVDIFRLAFLEARCAYLRVRWYNRLHTLARAQAAARRTHEHLVVEQRAVIASRDQTIERQRDMLERAVTLADYLHVTSVVDIDYEGGWLILIAASDPMLRARTGDTIVVVGRRSLEPLGTFRLTRMSQRGHHLTPEEVQDAASWSALSRLRTRAEFDRDAFVAILMMESSARSE